MQQPVEVVEAVAYARHVAVPKQVVCAVDVERTADALAEIAQSIVPAEQPAHPSAHPTRNRLEGLMYLGRGIEQNVSSPLLVMLRVGQHLLEQMGERPVTKVVEQRGGEPVAPGFLIQALFGREVVAACVDPALERLHDVSGSDRMGETRVLRTGKHERGEAKLPNSTQTLDFARIQQRLHDPLRQALEGDQTVDRVPQDHEATLPSRP